MVNTPKWNVGPRFDTIAVRGSYTHEESLKCAGSICEPLYLSPAQHFETSEAMRATLAGETPGWVYTRIDNPTVLQLEKVIAALEGYGLDKSVSSTVFSSGMAALYMTATALLANDPARPNANVVLPAACYGGSYMLFTERFGRDRGIELRWITNPLDQTEWSRAIDSDTRFALCEMPSNPMLQITDIPALAAIAKAAAVPLVVDATLVSPALLRPLGMGADIVIHSASKSMSASGLSIVGAVSSVPDIACAHPRREMAANFARFLKEGPRRDMGVVLSPFNALQTLTDLRNLRSRMDMMSATALRVAERLDGAPGIRQVLYPGLPSFLGHDIARRDMVLVDSELEPGGGQNRYGHLLSLRFDGGPEAACRFLDALKLIWRANDLGRVKSTATIPAISTHSQLSQDQKNATGIPPDLLRLSIGCEHADDLIADVEQALESIGHTR